MSSPSDFVGVAVIWFDFIQVYGGNSCKLVNDDKQENEGPLRITVRAIWSKNVIAHIRPTKDKEKTSWYFEKH